ncbi:MAG: polysaccharide pyruvyl transferase CsaB [Selenomonadaceae bacterium]|nr:polysaccharide pyruvyl transferase CsaB [Selenomonadaceae bacterium]
MDYVVISGYYGSGNGGDEAMLFAILSALREKDPDIYVTVISSNPEETAKTHKVNAVHWLNFAAITKEIFRAKLLISGGGSLLQNVTSKQSLYYYLGIIWIAEALNVPVMLYAQGIGPIYGKTARNFMKYVGDKAKVITVRDAGSIYELERLNITKPKIECTADPVLALTQRNAHLADEILKTANVDLEKKKIGIAVREWKGWLLYKEVLAEATDILRRELEVEIIYIPMQSPEDVFAAREVATLSKNGGVILEGPYDTEELLSLVGAMDLIIGVRLHALIFAAVMNVPMAGLSYDPKVGRFMMSMGDTVAGHIEDLQVETLVEAVKKKWENIEGIKKRQAELMPNLRKKALRNAELALSLIKGGNI